MADAGRGKKWGKRKPGRCKPVKRPRKAKAPPRRKKPDGQRRAGLIVAISHPLRRRILRAIADADERRSPVQLGKELEHPVGMIGYHVKVLHRYRAVEPAGQRMVRGAVEHFYERAIEDDPPIEALLEETKESDERLG